ncbi:sensor histidine kinase [Gynurincola endophyticus]|uniref:sensor histidine kinase n=1 Tax=Gynurincola endophyticus TaxID=2479004 RepID=UPI000F8CC75B|nr:HAMP domain-containing sensor histidine kinase [Gynurincola endophyticus]
MKKLLDHTLKPFIVYALLVLLSSIPVYFFLVDWIWSKELDENNQLIAQRIENEFNEQNINDEQLAESIRFWNNIQPVSKIEAANRTLTKDSTYTIRRQNPYSEHIAVDRFRVLERIIIINNRYFILTVETNVEESEETIAYIAAITFIFGIILITGFIILNRRLSQKLWKPFNHTLQKLKSFRLNNESVVSFQDTHIAEFKELHIALDKLISHSITTYQSQKEFTENASHELQTPIAIIKNKLDILLQDKSLTDNQYNIIEEINLTLLRMSRINKNLLLLAKIENKQFEDVQQFNLANTVDNAMNELDDFFENKQISLQKNLQPAIVTSNQALTEILMNNLLLNAIRHSPTGSSINIRLTGHQLTVANAGTLALDKNTLFDRFKKTAPDTKGSGLGLAIVKEICNNNGWTIDYRFEHRQHHFTLHF